MYIHEVVHTFQVASALHHLPPFFNSPLESGKGITVSLVIQGASSSLIMQELGEKSWNIVFYYETTLFSIDV